MHLVHKFGHAAEKMYYLFFLPIASFCNSRRANCIFQNNQSCILYNPVGIKLLLVLQNAFNLGNRGEDVGEKANSLLPEAHENAGSLTSRSLHQFLLQLPARTFNCQLNSRRRGLQSQELAFSGSTSCQNSWLLSFLWIKETVFSPRSFLFFFFPYVNTLQSPGFRFVTHVDLASIQTTIVEHETPAQTWFDMLSCEASRN